MPKVTQYNLGKGGVNVDKSPIHADPSELLSAQNTIHDPLGQEGGLKKRPGLVKLNGSAGAGTMLGGLSMPLFSYIDARRLWLAKQDGTTEKWYTSTDLFATSAASALLTAWQDPSEYYSLGANVSRMGVFFGGQLYYAAAGYTVGTTAPTIRVFNGSDDRELCKVLPATTKGITGMFSAKGKMYVLTLDSGTSDADWVGRCFQLATNGALTVQGTAFATGYVPQALAVHNNYLYVAVNRQTTTNEARIYRMNLLDESTWTLDATMDADDYQITALCSFQGLLYATTKNGGGATKGKIKKRAMDGTWSTVDSTVNNTGTYEDLCVFDGYLYASSRSYDTTTNTAVIRRSADGTTWATVYNSSSTTGVGWLTVLGLRIFSWFGTGLLHSTSGTSYTSATPGGANNAGGVLGTLIPGLGPEWEEPAESSGGVPDVSVVNNMTSVTQGDDLDNVDDAKRYTWYAIGGTTDAAYGWGVTTTGSAQSDSNTQTDSVYIRYNSSGVLNSAWGLTSSQGVTRLSFANTKRTLFRARIRTFGTNMAQHRLWIGLVDSSTIVNSDTLGVLGFAFRYSHPSGAAQEMTGNWNFVHTDGSTQTDVDTTVAARGGTSTGSVGYEFKIEIISSTSIQWTVTDLGNAATATGLVTPAGSPDTTVLMRMHCGGRDQTGAVKSLYISKLTLETN